MAKAKKENTSKTGKILVKKRGNPNVAEAGKATRFKKGFDPNRNLKGPPRKFNEMREMVLNLFSEEIEVEKKKKKTQLEKMLRDWLTSGDYNKQRAAVEYGYGKVPDETRDLSFIDDFILENIDLFTDGQILRIQQGDDKSAIVAEVMRDAVKVLKSKNQK